MILECHQYPDMYFQIILAEFLEFQFIQYEKCFTILFPGIKIAGSQYVQIPVIRGQFNRRLNVILRGIDMTGIHHGPCGQVIEMKIVRIPIRFLPDQYFRFLRFFVLDFQLRQQDLHLSDSGKGERSFQVRLGRWIVPPGHVLKPQAQACRCKSGMQSYRPFQVIQGGGILRPPCGEGNSHQCLGGSVVDIQIGFETPRRIPVLPFQKEHIPLPDLGSGNQAEILLQMYTGIRDIIHVEINKSANKFIITHGSR